MIGGPGGRGEGDRPTSSKRARHGGDLDSPKLPVSNPGLIRDVSNSSPIQIFGIAASLSGPASSSSSREYLPPRPPLLPSHTTSQEPVSHAASLLQRPHGLLPVASSPSARPLNRASLANLINPDPDIGFDILRDSKKSTGQSYPSGLLPSAAKNVKLSSSQTASPPSPQFSPPSVGPRTSLMLHLPQPHSSMALPPAEQFTCRESLYPIRTAEDDRGMDKNSTVSMAEQPVHPRSSYTYSHNRGFPDERNITPGPHKNFYGPEPSANPPSQLPSPSLGSQVLHDPELYVPHDQAWFVLGPRPGRNMDTWTIDRIGWYNEGYADAVEAVKGGVIGVNGQRYPHPIFWRPEDPNRALLNLMVNIRERTSRPGFMPVSPRQTSSGSGSAPQAYGTVGHTPGKRLPHHDQGFSGQWDHTARPDPMYSSGNKLSPTVRSGKRLPISCYPCRKRKLKCDGIVPCAPCVKRGSENECGYEKDVRRRGKGKRQLDEADWLPINDGRDEAGLGLKLVQGEEKVNWDGGGRSSSKDFLRGTKLKVEIGEGVDPGSRSFGARTTGRYQGGQYLERMTEETEPKDDDHDDPSPRSSSQLLAETDQSFSDSASPQRSVPDVVQHNDSRHVSARNHSSR